jgi:outer membrane immunogenic protein
MKRFWIGLAAVAMAMFSSASYAQVFNWTGTYVGAFGGYGWGSQGQHDACSQLNIDQQIRLRCRPGADGGYNVSGGLGGGIVGYSFPLSGITYPGSQLFNNTFFNQVIVGAEGDIAGSDLSGVGTCSIPGAPHPCGGNIYMMSDIRLRFGIPFGQFMPFFAGGLAVDDVHAYDSLFAVSATRLQAGWTVGGGLEYKITPQLSARVEYLYQALPRTSLFNVAPGVPEGVRSDVNVVRAGLVWTFAAPPPPAPPVIAKY